MYPVDFPWHQLYDVSQQGKDGAIYAIYQRF